MSTIASNSYSIAPKTFLENIALIAKPRTYLILTGCMIAFLIVMSTLSVAIGGVEKIADPIRYDQVSSILVKAFWVDRERSVPTLFNFTLLLAACSFLIVTARVAFVVGNPWRFHWLGFGIIFLLLSFDEAAQIHEGLVHPMRQAFDATGAFHFAWIIPALAFVVIFALASFNFLRALPRRIALLMVLGGALFVLGAIGMEMIAGWFADLSKSVDASSAWQAEAGISLTGAVVISSTVEEALEMTGVVVFSYAVLSLLSKAADPDQAYFKAK